MRLLPSGRRPQIRRGGGRVLASGALLLALLTSLTGQAAGTALAAPSEPSAAAPARQGAATSAAPAANAGPQAPPAADPKTGAEAQHQARVRALEQSKVAAACPADLAPQAVVSCGVGAGKSVSFSLTLPQQQDLVRYDAVTTQLRVTVKLLAPDGTEVGCRAVDGVPHCPTSRAGTYKLQFTNLEDLPSDLSVSYLALLSATTCKTVGAADSRLGAPTVFQGQVPLASAGDCYTLALAPNDMLRAFADTVHVFTGVYDGAGNKLCHQQGSSNLDCRLTGVAPFRVVTTATNGVSAPHRLTFARLSMPEGCPVLEPQAFGTAPDLSSTVPCRVLRATESARYTFGPVVPKDRYAPLGQLLTSGGTSKHDDCWRGYCDLTPGDYTWANTTQVLDASPFGMVFQSAKEVRGCTATHDNGMAAGPVKAVFGGPGQQLCLTLPTAAGNGVYLLNPSATNGLHAAVYDAAGSQQCELDGPTGGTYVSCRLTGTAPFRAVLSGTPATSVDLTIHRTGEHAGCTAWPRTGFDGAAGVQVVAARQACLSIPGDQHSTSELIDYVNADHRRDGEIQLVDPSGTEVCTANALPSCRLAPGVPYTAMLRSRQTSTYELARRDVSSAAACTATTPTKVGGPATPVALGSPLDARCLRIGGAATDKYWLGDRMPGRYLTNATSTWLTVVDAEGRLLCQQASSVSCKVTGSTSYTAVLTPHNHAGQPLRSSVDIWKVGTANGWAPECTADPISVDGFALRNGVLSETSTAHCAVVDMRPDESFNVTGIRNPADKGAPAPALSLHTGREWGSANPRYNCTQQWDRFSAECRADREAEPSQALLMLSAGRTPTPAVYSVRAVCGRCSAPDIEAPASIGPDTSAVNTQTQAVVRGASLTMNTRLKLVRDGSDKQPVLTPVSVNADRTALTVQVDTRGLEAGQYDVVLDGVGYTAGVPSQGYLPKAYTVTPEDTTGKGRFVPIGPSRFLDTREGLGAPKARVGAGGVVTLQVAGVKGVPATGVTAVVMNVTAVSPTAAGHVMVYPNGRPQPTVSNINFSAGQIVPNLVTVAVVNGKVDLRNHAGSVDLIADVTGYYTDKGPGSALTPLSPSRFLDTREGLGAPRARVGAGGVVTLQVAGVKGVPAAGVTAVVMNVTAVSPTEAGFVTVYPNGQAVPGVSNLNFTAGQIVPNLVTVPVVNGKVDLRNHAGAVDLVADVTGYYSATGSTFSAASPVRLLDTRTPIGGHPAPAGGGETIDLKVAGVEGVPATGVTAVVLNVTVTAPASDSFLTVYPHGVARPHVSNLNFRAGQTVSNLVIVPVIDGRVSFHSPYGPVDVIADLNGWFTG
ncbi:hypothetical protein [Streptomyces sp. 3211]|uniref:hypothetical protein n=1 Tax=Streptomyces sp. 3211 TaxID=1964449 RepID=UPI00133135E8|nr:hypothetical protein [Streptomyces sp. 3211]